jgi:hypothetical protein
MVLFEYRILNVSGTEQACSMGVNGSVAPVFWGSPMTSSAGRKKVSLPGNDTDLTPFIPVI